MANGYVPRQRSLAGPVLLILLGVFFFLHTAGLVSWSFWDLFARFWPLLLILWGVIRLVEYQRAQATGMPTPRMGAGGIILLIFLIMIGLGVSRSVRYWPGIRDNIRINDEDFPFWGGGSSFDYEDQLEQDIPSDASLRITCERGDLNVNSADNEKIRVMVRKHISASSQKDADRENGDTKPRLEVSGKVVTLSCGNADHRRISTDLDVYVPRKIPLVITSKRGNVAVLGRAADVEMSTGKGEISLDDITGNAKISVDKSSVKVSRVSGNVSVDGGEVGETSINDVKGTVRLSGDFPDNVSLSRIAKTVSFKSSRTDLEFAGLEGTLELDGGDLRGSSVPGPVRLLTKEKDIRLDGTNGDMRVSNTNGVVEVRVNKLPVGDVDISNRNADVQVYLPDAAGFRVDASTQNGEVQSDFPGVQVRNEEDRGSLSGSVGNGKGMIKVSNAHGSIEIRKGSAMALAAPPDVSDVPSVPNVGPGHGPPPPPKPGKTKKLQGEVEMREQ